MDASLPHQNVVRRLTLFGFLHIRGIYDTLYFCFIRLFLWGGWYCGGGYFVFLFLSVCRHVDRCCRSLDCRVARRSLIFQICRQYINTHTHVRVVFRISVLGLAVISYSFGTLNIIFPDLRCVCNSALLPFSF